MIQKLNSYSEVTEDIIKLSELIASNMKINPELYGKYEVKRGLRDISGRGVLAGLTNIAEVKSYTIDDGEMIPCEGKLYYHGYDVDELVKGFVRDRRQGFEETVYLLLFGELPTPEELKFFNELLVVYRDLPTSFTRDVILKAPSRDMMNSLARSVLTLYSYDDKADDTTIPNVLRQSIQLISLFPRLAVYAYHGFKHYHDEQSLYIHTPLPDLSTAQNILYMLRPDSQYTELEAEILDIALVLHADHGGGNNSTFSTRVITSSGTDTYSAIAAGIGALKGPLHGGANIKVSQMIDDMKEHVNNWKDDREIEQYLADLIDKKAFDKLGKVYGMGHAVYSLSDPRALIFKQYVELLSKEKGLEEEFELYARVERLAPQVIAEKKKMYKGVSANIDFYSGFVYRTLGLPEELFTPIFAISRIPGWCAHRIEELNGNGKITRPAYKSVRKHRDYVKFSDR